MDGSGGNSRAPRGSTDCTSQDKFFAGGNGDFSVILDAQATYAYFFFSSYAGDLSGQGVAVAQMDWQFRDNPSGNVWKWYQGSFSQPGRKGVLTARFPPTISWMQSNGGGYWGPSVHWNTYLNQYVMLLNNVVDSASFKQQGIYISYSSNLGDPTSWSDPQPLAISTGGYLDSSQFYFPAHCPSGQTCKARNWYPQVIGEDPGGTDKIAGQRSRFFLMEGLNSDGSFSKEASFSRFELVFP